MTADSSGFTILLTSATDDSEYFIDKAGKNGIKVVHFPLEKYVKISHDGKRLNELILALESAENIIYGHKRNAKFLVELVHQHNLMKKVTNQVNLAANPRIAQYLEEHGIPAICPGSEEPIAMLEFMMRLRRLGPSFYPCGTHNREEIPGLLVELDIPVCEHALYELEGPTDEELNQYREQMQKISFDGIIYHSRRAVNRIHVAFPNLDIADIKVIAGDKGVAQKLADQNIESDEVAEGDWNSILEKIKKMI